jgi:MFS family permease
MRNIILLGLASLLTDISSEMVYPLLPLFLSSLGGGPAILGIIEGAAESTASLLKVFSGYWSDHLRRRKPLAIAGYAGSTIGKLSLALAGGWPLVLAGRLVDRFGKGIRTAPRDALIAESAREGERGRAFGLHRAMDTAGAALGVLAALALLSVSTADLRTVILLSVIPALCGVLLLFLVREPGDTPAVHAPHTILRFAHLPPPLRRFLLVTFLFSIASSSNTFLLLRTSSAGVSVPNLLLLYLLYNLTYSALSYPAGRLSDRVGRKWLLVAGYIVYAGVYIGFGALPEKPGGWLFAALFATYGVYSGLSEGIEKALVADLAPAEHRATAIGLHATILGIGLLPASLIAGQLWMLIGPSAPFVFGGCTALLAAVLLTILL